MSQQPEPTKQKERTKAYEERLAQAEELLGKKLASRNLGLEDYPMLTDEQLKELLKKNLGKISNLSEIMSLFKKYRDEITIENQAKPMERGIEKMNGLNTFPY